MGSPRAADIDQLMHIMGVTGTPDDSLLMKMTSAEVDGLLWLAFTRCGRIGLAWLLGMQAWSTNWPALARLGHGPLRARCVTSRMAVVRTMSELAFGKKSSSELHAVASE